MGRYSQIDLSRDEMKVWNDIPVSDPRRISFESEKSTMRSTTSLIWLFKLCCNEFCKSIYLFHQAVHKCESSKPSGEMGTKQQSRHGVTINFWVSLFLIRSYDVPNDIVRYSVAQCYGNSWPLWSKVKSVSIVNCYVATKHIKSYNAMYYTQ